MNQSTLQDRVSYFIYHIDHKTKETFASHYKHFTTPGPLTDTKKCDSTTPPRDTDSQDEFNYQVINPGELSMCPIERREVQFTMTRKGQNKKGLLEIIFEMSVQDPLALEQLFPPDIN